MIVEVPPKPARPSKSNGEEAAAAACILGPVGDVTLRPGAFVGAERLLFENKSISSSRGFFAAATEAIAADEGAKLAGTVFVPMEVSAIEGSSASKSSRFSDFCPATTVSRAFCVEVSASSKLHIGNQLDHYLSIGLANLLGSAPRHLVNAVSSLADECGSRLVVDTG